LLKHWQRPGLVQVERHDALGLRALVTIRIAAAIDERHEVGRDAGPRGIEAQPELTAPLLAVGVLTEKSFGRASKKARTRFDTSSRKAPG
jgi:hypothetical protein